MTIFICTACGTSFPNAPRPPDRCRICDDERQYVPAAGQGWTTQDALAATHRNAWREHEPGLLSLQTIPAFAINQRAFLLRTPAGNVLWDCVALLDTATRAIVHGLGGIHAIAISHPHYYTAMQDWAEAFEAPIHLHEADRAWVMRPDPSIQFWSGASHAIAPGVKLICLGGHFPGGTVLRWAAGTGVLLAGDVLQVTPGARRVSFMWSYPNMMPLQAATIREIEARLQPWSFERIYGAFVGQDILQDGKAIVARSAQRYIELVSGTEKPGVTDGLVTVVTGGGSGIGAALCRRLAGDGARLLLHTGSNRVRAEAVAATVRDAGGEAEVVVGSFDDPARAASVVAAALQRWGRVDRVVHAAGFADRRPFGSLDAAGFERSMANNAGAFFHLATAALPALRDSPAARIVAIGSFLGHSVRFGPDMLFPATTASKAALAGLVRALAMQLAPERIPVNCVVPGFIAKDRGTPSALDQAARARVKALVPFGRHGEPDEVAAAIEYLLGPGGSYITGQMIHVDGGLTL